MAFEVIAITAAMVLAIPSVVIRLGGIVALGLASDDAGDIADAVDTVFSAPLIVIMAVVILAAIIGWAVSNRQMASTLKVLATSNIASVDGNTEQARIFRDTVEQSGNVSMQLLSANAKHVAVLDRLTDEVSRIADTQDRHHAEYSEAIQVSRQQSKDEHVEIEGKVTRMETEVTNIALAIKQLQAQQAQLLVSVNYLCEKDTVSDEDRQEMKQQLAIVVEGMKILVKAYNEQQTGVSNEESE